MDRTWNNCLFCLSRFGMSNIKIWPIPHCTSKKMTVGRIRAVNYNVLIWICTKKIPVVHFVDFRNFSLYFAQHFYLCDQHHDKPVWLTQVKLDAHSLVENQRCQALFYDGNRNEMVCNKLYTAHPLSAQGREHYVLPSHYFSMTSAALCKIGPVDGGG